MRRTIFCVMNFKFVIFIASAFFIIFSSLTFSQSEDFSVQLKLGYSNPITTWRIGGDFTNERTGKSGSDLDTISKLEFDLPILMAEGQITKTLTDKTTVVLSLASSIADSTSGSFVDMDYYQNFQGLAKEGTADLEGSVLFLDLHLDHTLVGEDYDDSKLKVSLGYKHGRISHTVFDLQHNDYRQPVNSKFYSGDVIDYELSTHTAYTGLTLEQNLGDRITAHLGAKVGAVVANDEDQHLLRERSYESDNTGLMFGVETGFRWDINDSVFFQAAYSYEYLKAEGEKHVSQNGRSFLTIDGDIEQSISTLTCGFGFCF